VRRAIDERGMVADGERRVRLDRRRAPLLRARAAVAGRLAADASATTGAVAPPSRSSRKSFARDPPVRVSGSPDPAPPPALPAAHDVRNDSTGPSRSSAQTGR
jgi:hypothetical protein